MGVFDALFERDLFVIARPGAVTGRDALGRPIKGTSRSEPIDGILRQTGSIEGEAFVVDEFKATLPLGTVLRVNDTVEARGQIYKVKGSPFETIVPRSRIGVLSATLEYVGPVNP